MALFGVKLDTKHISGPYARSIAAVIICQSEYVTFLIWGKIIGVQEIEARIQLHSSKEAIILVWQNIVPSHMRKVSFIGKRGLIESLYLRINPPKPIEDPLFTLFRHHLHTDADSQNRTP